MINDDFQIRNITGRSDGNVLGCGRDAADDTRLTETEQIGRDGCV